MARQQTRTTLLKELDAIQTKLKHLEKVECDRISRVALKVGLAELELDDSTLTAELQGIVSRFRPGSSAGLAADPASSPEGRSRSGASSDAG